MKVGTVRRRKRCTFCAILLVLWPVLGAAAGGSPIYRWVAPNGVVGYGDHPPANARNVTVIGTQTPPPPTPPPSPAHSGGEAESSQRQAATQRMEEELLAARILANRLNLLTAIQNYENSQAMTHPPHSVYTPPYFFPPEPGFRPRPHRPPGAFPPPSGRPPFKAQAPMPRPQSFPWPPLVYPTEQYPPIR